MPPPDHAEITRRLTEILTGHFGLSAADLRPEAALSADLGLDSIDAIDLVVALEKETGLKLTAAELRPLRTVGDVVEAVHRRLSSS
jgi:acyl carrier protein